MANFLEEKTALDDWWHASGSVDVGEPGYLIASVTRGKKVTVGPIMTSANYL